MNSTCSPEPEAASSPGNCSGIAASAPSKSTRTANASCSPVSATGACQSSQSSAISSASMLDPSEAALTSWLAGFHAKSTAAHLEDAAWRKTSGRNSSGSWQMPLLGLSLPRTSHARPSTQRPTTLSRWVTPSDAWRYPRQTWVLTTFGSGTGYLHTPTHTANYACPSMQKWPNCREFVRVFGKPDPMSHEWLMAWPPGWSGLSPLGTGKCQSWRQQHFESSPET